MPYRPIPPSASPTSHPQPTAAGPPDLTDGSPPASAPPMAPAVPVVVVQSSDPPLNTLGLGSLPSFHEGGVPDPLMRATLHATLGLSSLPSLQ